MRVAIVGGSGYAGGELLRLLLLHPETEIEQVTSTTYVGEFLYTLHPNLRGFTNIKFSQFNPETIVDTCDTVFLATPHGVSKDLVPLLLNDRLKIVDLSADFRLYNAEDYPKWY
ncbi:N-acetyl-gamma-glutamyl-phosphate reductase, partial [bacterium]|nr:N-acetyl-gamma-glutamyl-phosphate reductase [bacterium]